MLPKQEYVGMLIGAARRRIKQAVLSRLSPYGLSSQQFWVLLAVRAQPGASAGELAGRQGLDAPTASRIIASLHRRKLLRLNPDPGDRRRARVSLSKAGEALAGRLQPIADGVRAAVVEDLSPREQEALRGSLRKVMESLARFEDAGPPDGAAARAPAQRKSPRRRVSP